MVKTVYEMVRHPNMQPSVFGQPRIRTCLIPSFRIAEGEGNEGLDYTLSRSAELKLIPANMSVPKIQSVAVIGAGLGGVVAAAQLRRAGLAVTVFERGDRIGGVWLYSEQPASEPAFPNTRPEPAPAPNDNNSAVPEGGEDEATTTAQRAFAPPGPTYTNMKSRGSEATMRTTLRDWPVGVRAPIPHADVVAYIEAIADAHGVRDAIRFRTRVDAVTSRPDASDGGRRWRVQTSRLLLTAMPTGDGGGGGRVECEPAQDFDAVVVATGRYNAPRVPDVPGLARWKARFPGRVHHTKQVRRPGALCSISSHVFLFSPSPRRSVLSGGPCTSLSNG